MTTRRVAVEMEIERFNESGSHTRFATVEAVFDVTGNDSETTAYELVSCSWAYPWHGAARDEDDLHNEELENLRIAASEAYWEAEKRPTTLDELCAAILRAEEMALAFGDAGRPTLVALEEAEAAALRLRAEVVR